MVQNGKGKYKTKTLSGIDEKTITEDETARQQVVIFLTLCRFQSAKLRSETSLFFFYFFGNYYSVFIVRIFFIT